MSWLSGYLGNQPNSGGGANSRPSRSQPRPNYVELSDEEDLESGLNFDSPLTSPGRPAQSPSVSPRALLIPDPLDTSEVLDQVQEKLSNLPEGVIKVEVVEEGHVTGLPEVEVQVENAAAMPDNDVVDPVDFEDENVADDAKSLE